MSGEAGVDIGVALIALPIIAVAGAGWLVYQTGKAMVHGASAINKHVKEAKRKRELELNNVEGELRQSIQSLNSVSNQFSIQFDDLIKNTSASLYDAGRNLMDKAEYIDKSKIEQYSQTINNVSADINSKFQNDYANISKKYASEIAENTRQLKSRIKTSLQQSERELEGLKANRTAYKNKACSMAKEAIESAEQYINYIKNNSSMNSSFAGKIHTLEFNLNNAVSHYNNEMYDASYASAENLKYVALDVLNDMLIEKNEIERYRTMLIFEINKLKSIINQNAEINFDYEGNIIKGNIYDYSEGLIQGLKSSIERIESCIGNDNLSLKELKDYYTKVTQELSPSFTKIWNWSVKNLENTYIRKDIAQTVTETIENQNFVMTESGYKGDSETNDLYIKFKNNATSEEIMVIIKPDDKPGKIGTTYEVHQLSEGVNPDRQEEIRNDINTGVAEYYHSHDMSVHPCVKESIGNPSHLKNVDIADIKKGTQKRSPMI